MDWLFRRDVHFVGLDPMIRSEGKGGRVRGVLGIRMVTPLYPRRPRRFLHTRYASFFLVHYSKESC